MKNRAAKGSEKYKDEKYGAFNDDGSNDQSDDDYDPKLNRASTDNSGVEMSELKNRGKKG